MSTFKTTVFLCFLVTLLSCTKTKQPNKFSVESGAETAEKTGLVEHNEALKFTLDYLSTQLDNAKEGELPEGWSEGGLITEPPSD